MTLLRTISCCGLCILIISPFAAHAIPAFQQQTGQPCNACHIGAFGSQLKPFGREFKLYGYVGADENKPQPPLPLALTVQTGFVNTNAGEPGTPHVGANDNLTLDQISLFYGGRITESVGAFAQVTYDGVSRKISWDNMDIRHAQEISLFGDGDLVLGQTINNAPSVTDLWNSTPVWGFPYNSSNWAAAPANATAMDNGWQGKVIGAGVYAMFDNLLYLEADLYHDIDSDLRNGLGVTPVAGADELNGVMPYARLSLQHKLFGKDWVELGAFGLKGDLYPGNDRSAGTTDRFTDWGVDASYQFLRSPRHILSWHATYINETRDLGASAVLIGAQGHDKLSTFRTDLTYAYDNMILPTVQWFSTRGTTDAAYWNTANGSPNSSGWIYDLGYTVGGRANSIFPDWFNARIGLQYIRYHQFDGLSGSAASANNVILLSLWMATGWPQF